MSRELVEGRKVGEKDRDSPDAVRAGLGCVSTSIKLDVSSQPAQQGYGETWSEQGREKVGSADVCTAEMSTGDKHGRETSRRRQSKKVVVQVLYSCSRKAFHQAASSPLSSHSHTNGERNNLALP